MEVFEDASFLLKYKTDEVQPEGFRRDHAGMDAGKMADSIRGFADFVEIATKEYLGSKTVVKPKVLSVKPGSTIIQILPDIMQISADLLKEPAGTAATLMGVVGYYQFIEKCFKLYEHLKGEAPKEVKQVKNVKNSAYAEVTNNTGDVMTVNIGTLNVVLDPTAGKSAAKFAGRAIRKKGESLTISANENELVSVTKENADYFKVIPEGRHILESTVDIQLRIVVPVFEGRQKWKFNDGRNTFPAEIEHEDFIEGVDTGEERFGKNDIIFVRLRSVQRRINGKLHTDHFIEEVYEHEEYIAEQGDLPL